MSETLTPENAALALSLNMDPETGLALSEDTRARLQALVDSAQAPAVGTAAAENDVYASLMGAGPAEEQEYPHVGGYEADGTHTATAGAQQEVDVAAALAALQAQVNNLAQSGGQQQQLTIDDVLQQIDPRDSETALAMFQWLIDNGRLQNIGTINGGGYLFHYAEPKGTSKAGYTPGKTQGGRMVDAAVAKAKESGATKRLQSMCPKCFSVVTKDAAGTVVLDGDNPDPTCPAGGSHTWGE